MRDKKELQLQYINSAVPSTGWPELEMCCCCYSFVPPVYSGPGSSVGVATDYRLDGPRSNPGGDEIFHPSRLALGSTQPPVQWVSGLSQG